MLTAKVDRSSKLLGLEIGADDYVCKPFDIDELLLRIKVLLKRTEGNVYYGKWHIDEEKFTATVSAKTLAFSAIEFKLFSLLFKSPDRIFSREQIINLAYSEYHDITDRTIDSHVRNLRKKFKEADIEPSPIQSVYGAGYRFHKDPTIR
jgi:two-component system response regulator BaeR